MDTIGSVRQAGAGTLTYPEEESKSMASSLARNIVDAAERFGDRPAVKLDDFALTWEMLAGASAHVAGLLAEEGVRPGDRVGLMLPNIPQFPVAYYGILRAGGIVVPMNVLLKEREVAYYLEDSGAEVLFAWEGMIDHARAGAEQAGATLIPVDFEGFVQRVGAATPVTELPDRGGSDTAVLLYTSGTTGSPKGAELTHDNLCLNAEASRGLYDGGPDDVMLGALPLFHAFGQTCAMNVAALAGACLSLIPRFEPEKALEILQRDRVTIFLGVPTMYGALLHASGRERFDVSSLRLCVSGGAALPVELLHGFEEAFGCAVLEGYGLSETSPVASFNHLDRERKPGSIGTPIAGVEMKLVDEAGHEVAPGEVGEIVIKGPNVMKGYWNKPEATADAIVDGWFHSGDLARRDEDGYFFIVDRKKEMIVRGGYNVYPREVEEVLYEHPAVREAAVIGVPDEAMGEEVGAAIVLKDGAEATEEEIRAFVKDQVAGYKYPRRIWFADELPKGPTGKILKREIHAPARVAGGD
jgi:long-chain acyl-CoA synthetase